MVPVHDHSQDPDKIGRPSWIHTEPPTIIPHDDSSVASAAPSSKAGPKFIQNEITPQRTTFSSNSHKSSLSHQLSAKSSSCCDVGLTLTQPGIMVQDFGELKSER